MISNGRYVLSSEEQRRKKADALLESHEATEQLSLLLSEASTLGNQLMEVGRRIRDLRGVNETGNAEREVLSANLDLPDRPTLVALINSILDARERVRKAQERTRDLALTFR